MHDTQTTTERRNRSCLAVHGNVSRAPTALSYGPPRTFDDATIQPAFLGINIGRRIGTGSSNSAWNNVSMTTRAPGGGPVQEERRKTVVTVQWPPEDGREDDVQTTYGPWYVVRDTCWKETLSELTLTDFRSCTYGGYHFWTHKQKVIAKTYLRPIPANLPALTQLKGPKRQVSSTDNCNPPPSNPYTSSGGGGGSSDDDDYSRTAYCHGSDCYDSNSRAVGPSRGPFGIFTKRETVNSNYRNTDVSRNTKVKRGNPPSRRD